MNVTNRALSAVLCTLSLVGCVTSSETPQAEKRLVDRSPGRDSKPAWIDGPEKVKEADIFKYRIYLSMDAESRGDACTEAAGVSGRGKVVEIIASDILKTAGYSTEERSSALHSVTTQISHESLSGMEVVDSYWELVDIVDDDIHHRRLDCWAQLEVPKSIIDDAKTAANKMHRSINTQLQEQKADLKDRQENGDADPAH